MRTPSACDDIGPDNLLGSNCIERDADAANADAPDPQRINILTEQDSAMKVATQAIGSRSSRPLDFIRPGDGDPRHGTTNGYVNLICKCPECKAAHAAYRRDLRRRRREAAA